MELRDLPSVDELAREAGDPLAIDAARAVIDRARDEIQAGADPGDLAARLRDELTDVRRPRLQRVLNATGVVVHTNLGRAPLADEAAARVARVARGYSNLEYDLGEGARGSRQDHVAAILRRLTGAEAALVVNNNAAAVLLALAALAEGRDVVVSRGELIEIGDGFRIPEVLARSGAHLVEVGTTNRTRAADYEHAVGPETAVVLRVHQSNFRVVGFEERPRLEEVVAVAHRHGLPLVDDLGSGAIAPVEAEPTAPESLAAGPTSSVSPETSSSAGRRRGSCSAVPTSSSGCAVTRSSAHCGSTSSRSLRSRARFCSTSRRRSGFRCCARSRRRRAPCVSARIGWQPQPGEGSRRRSGASAAARSRSFNCRASRARSRSRSQRRYAPASRRSWASSATAGSSSTASR